MSSPRRNRNAAFVSGQEVRPRREQQNLPISELIQRAAEQEQRDAAAASAARAAAQAAAASAAASAARAAAASAARAVSVTGAPQRIDEIRSNAIAEAVRAAKDYRDYLLRPSDAASPKPELAEELIRNEAIAAARRYLSREAVGITKYQEEEIIRSSITEASKIRFVMSDDEEMVVNELQPGEDEVDIDEEREVEEEFIEVISNYQEQQDTLNGADNKAKRTPLEMIKDTVHQQIFVNSGMLTDLGDMFECEIIFRRKNGRYAFFIRPRNTNYMIHITNGTKDNQDRIFFNLSLKTDAESSTGATAPSERRKIRTEYICEYAVKDGHIYHKYEMDGTPAVIKKNRVNLKLKEKIFNPYLKLNELVEKYLGYGERIFMDSPLALIHEKIEKLRKRLGSSIPEDLQKIMHHFENEKNKTEIDTSLNKDYYLLKKFTSLQLGNKQVENIDYKIQNKLLYRTNNKFTNALAFRYATYIKDFEFTKSCNGAYTYTDPFSFKLATPFTATDIYLHRFDRHFDDEYAMYRYDLDSPEKLHRLAELVELCKSLMMNFISISYYIASEAVLYRERVPMNVDIHNIYPELIWNRGTRPVWSKLFEVYKHVQGGNLSRIDIDVLRTKLPVTGKKIDLMTAIEIPFVGISPPVDIYQSCSTLYKKIPVVAEEDKKSFDEIDLQGVERYMFEANTISTEVLGQIYFDFFKSIREETVKTTAKKAEYVELTKDEFREMFPELGKIVAKTGTVPGVVSVIDQAGQTILEEPEFKPKYALSPSAAQAAPSLAAQTAPAAAVPSSASVAKISSTPITMASIVRTQIPYSQDISKVIMDIRKFQKDNLKPIPGESRRLRGIRLKQFRPMIERLEQLRRTQLETLHQTGQKVPADIGRQIAKLHEEGIGKLTRTQQAYYDLEKSVKENTTELNKLAETIREYERTAKSETQKLIHKIKEQILNEKRLLYIIIPNEILSQGSSAISISKTMYKILKQRQTEIQDKIDKLEKDLKVLEARDIEEQKVIADTRARMSREEQEAIRREEERIAAQADAKRKQIEEDERSIQESKELYKRLKERASELKEKITAVLIKSNPDSPLYKYYNRALEIVRKTIKSYKEHVTAIEYLAAARAKTEEQSLSKKDMDTYVKSYRETLTKSRDNMMLFTEIEESLNKTPDEIETIAMKLYGSAEEKPLTVVTDETVAVEKLEKSKQKRLQQIAEERRVQSQRLEELETQRAEAEAKTAALLAKLSEAEAVAKLDELEDIAKQNEKTYYDFFKLYTKHSEIIEQLSGEIKHISSKITGIHEKIINKRLDATRITELLTLQKQTEDLLKIEESVDTRRTLKAQLVDINNELYNPILAPVQKKALLKELDELKETLVLLNAAFELKTLEQNTLVLENEKFINTYSKIKGPQKEKLLAQLEKIKSNGTAGTLQSTKQIFDTNILENQELIRNNTHLRDNVKTYLLKKLEKLTAVSRVASTSTPTAVDKESIARAKLAEKQAVEEERKKFVQWEKEHAKIFDEIRKMETELKGSNPLVVEGGLMRQLHDVNKQLSNTNIALAKKTKLEKERDELNTKIRVISAALDKKMEMYNKFLLANESLIRNNVNFKDTKLKIQLIKRIERYNEELLHKLVEDEEPSGASGTFDPFGSTRPVASAEEGETFSIY